MLNLDVNNFLLHADKINFLNVVDIEQQAANILRVLAQFLIAEAVAGERVNRTEDLIISVVVVGAKDAVGQVGDVLAVVANVAPQRPNRRSINRIFQLDVNNRCARTRLTAHVVKSGDVLQLLFNLVSNLRLHFFGGGTGPVSGNKHIAHDELRILHAPKFKVRQNSSDERHDDKIPHQRTIVQRQFG